MIPRAVKRAPDRESGFTLIELLVVVIIVGILAAIAIPVFLAQRERAWRGSVQSDLRNYAITAETQLTDTGTYAGLATPAPDTSPDVTVTVEAATAQTYCLEGFHANNTTEIWSIRPGGAGLTQAAC